MQGLAAIVLLYGIPLLISFMIYFPRQLAKIVLAVSAPTFVIGAAYCAIGQPPIDIAAFAALLGI
jgi:hypothetical protein